MHPTSTLCIHPTDYLLGISIRGEGPPSSITCQHEYAGHRVDAEDANFKRDRGSLKISTPPFTTNTMEEAWREIAPTKAQTKRISRSLSLDCIQEQILQFGANFNNGAFENNLFRANVP